jgi:hypothetical protein
MPPRLSKRQQREKEEMEALASPLSQSQIQSLKSPIIKDSGSVDEDPDEASDRKPKFSVGPVKSAFAIVSVMD